MSRNTRCRRAARLQKTDHAPITLSHSDLIVIVDPTTDRITKRGVHDDPVCSSRRQNRERGRRRSHPGPGRRPGREPDPGPHPARLHQTPPTSPPTHPPPPPPPPPPAPTPP